MKKIIVFQHSANKILGTLNPTIKERGLNIRYINFDRSPDESPSLDKYDGLVILGGNMAVYEADIYKHIKVELRLIEEALKKDIPILGICLGSQLLAHVLGSTIRKADHKEIGWHDVELTPMGQADPLLDHFQKKEKLFQLHGDTFDIPTSAIHLARSELCNSQAFRYNKAYGFQFHLEVDEAMILRWLSSQQNQAQYFSQCQLFDEQKIKEETKLYLEHSTDISKTTFNKFADFFQLKTKPIRLGSL